MMEVNRRDVLKTALAGAAMQAARGAERPLKIGFIGLGTRGSALLEAALRFDAVEIAAVSDGDASNVSRAQQAATRGGRRPQGYGAFRQLCDSRDLDLIINAAPRRDRAAVALAAMEAGKHVASEGPAAGTVDECWKLVETARKTNRQCSLVESECYTATSLLLLNMFRGGLLGEPLFAEAGYCRDLRGTPEANAGAGNLMPTPAFGPVAWWMDVNRGDRCTHLVSRTTKGADLNTTLIHTDRGRVVSLYYNAGLPRPAEGMLRVQGSKGAYSGIVDKIFVDGQSLHENKGPNEDPRWDDPAEFEKQFRHPLWTAHGEKGSDYVLLYRLFKSIRENRPADIDVYDTAAWSAIAPLTAQSVAEKQVVEFPDFTRGEWKSRAPLAAASLV